MSWVGQSVLFSMRRELFAHLQRLSFNFYDRMEAGRIMSRMTGDVNALNEFLTSVVAIVSDIFVLIGIVAIMFTMNWELASIVLLVLPIIAVATHLPQALAPDVPRGAHPERRRHRAPGGEHLRGAVVQAFAREDTNLQNFDVVNRENLRAC